jgi:cytochrome P450
MKSFFVAMILWPDVQKKAQDELDSVIGRDRLPTFEDRPMLPFIDAVCKETLRWRPVSPVGGSPQ